MPARCSPHPPPSAVSNLPHQRQGSRQDGGSESFFGQPGLAQTGKISGFKQGADLEHAPPCAWKGLQVRDARIKGSAIKPPSLGKLHDSALQGATEGIGGGKVEVIIWLFRTGTARFFEPDDRLVDARLQQMHHPDNPVPNTDLRVPGATADR